jgi:hypothetical protein
MSITHTTPTKKRLSNVVRYILKPINTKAFTIESNKILKLLVLEMKGFRYYRLWGKWNNKPKKSKGQKKSQRTRVRCKEPYKD